MSQNNDFPFAEPESAFLYPSDTPMRAAKNMEKFLPDIRQTVCLPLSCTSLVPEPKRIRMEQGLRDDNRSLILPDYLERINGRNYYLEVKGIGARVPMYGFMMPDDPTFVWGSRFHGRGISEHWKTMVKGEPRYMGEMWFGNAPYGGHGTSESLDSVAITELCIGMDPPNCLNGFWFCPVLYSIELPKWVVNARKDYFWYRRYPGKWSQQFRLVPSNTRLYFHSDCTLGIAPGKVLTAFGIETPEDMDMFIENYIGSGSASLTLAARTCKVVDDHYEILDYDDVWLDKDSIIAPDGTLHFADIDDLEWREYRDQAGVRKKFRRQLERNFFEFMFGLDALLSERYLMEGKELTAEERRRDIAVRFEMALMTDQYAHPEIGGEGLDVFVNAPGIIDEPERIRLIDLK
jgi:hypothetical protein